MNIAVILAGGVGSRVGENIPKQFIRIQGKPVLVYTMEIFQGHPEIDAIEVVCIRTHMDMLKDMVHAYGLTKVRWVTEGGKDFQHSVINGIENLRGAADKEDIVLVHYGVSPFVSDEIISDGIRVCREKGNCTSATPCFLLMGNNEGGTRSTRWIDRDKVMQLNSPQCFTFGYIDSLYREAIQKGILEKSEPHTTSLMYLMGRTIYFSKGNQGNIKITTREDLELFEGYILRKKYMEEKKNDNSVY